MTAFSALSPYCVMSFKTAIPGIAGNRLIKFNRNTHQTVRQALNHKTGDKVALAQVGARLKEDFTIKKGKIRGEESNGMLCSEDELV